jgi:hypothetical protein
MNPSALDPTAWDGTELLLKSLLLDENWPFQKLFSQIPSKGINCVWFLWAREQNNTGE